MPTPSPSIRLHTPRHSQYGLTLVELIVTVALLALLLGLALPSFTPLLERWRANQAIAELESTLFYARSEGIRRGGNLTLIRITDDNNNCTTLANEWQCGWRLIADSDQDGQADAGTTPLKTTSALTSLIVTASANSNAITIDRWGGLSLLGAGNRFSFSAHPASQSTTNTSQLCIQRGGHLRKIKADEDCDA